MRFNVESLKNLLEKTRRLMIINGRPLPQVDACVLRFTHDVIFTTTIVKDGKTSVARFVNDNKDASNLTGHFIISNIEMFLGALSVHRGLVDITRIDDNKIILKSKKKQTTLVSSKNAPAFSHSHKTVQEWESDSLDRFTKIDYSGLYTTENGDVITPIASFEVDSSVLREAIKCGNVNSQKISQYKFFIGDNDKLHISVGDRMKGETTTQLHDDDGWDNVGTFETTVEGGLDFALKGAKGNVNLHFLDFTKVGAGISLLMVFEGCAIFQREIPNV